MKKPARKLSFNERIGYWLRHFKPIHLCWWFERHGWKVPKYLISTSSNYDLTHYVFGTDSGDSDPDAQTMGSEDDPLTNQAKETPFFIRFQVRETGGKAGANNYWQLYYNTTNDPATASQLTTAGDGVVQIIDDPGSNITNFTATDTRLMSEFTGETYISGEYVDNADDTNAKYQLDSSDVLGYVEFMWCIQFESGAGDSTDYYFYPRCGDAVMDSHSVHPKATTTVAANPDVNMADENPDITDEVVVEITPYLINQADENPEVTDYANVVATYAIKADEDIGVTEEIEIEQILGINVNDSIGMTDYGHIGQMSVYGSYYDVDLLDSGWLDVVRDVCYINGLSGDSTMTLNVTDPTTPIQYDEIIDHTNLNGAEFIQLWGDICYMTAIYDNRFLIIDVKNPSDISIYNSYQLATELSGAAGMCVVENLDGRERIAFIAAYNGARITALDISDRDNISLVDSYYDVTNLNQVINCVYKDGYLFCVARASKKFTVLDVSDPDSISLVTALDDPVQQRFERLGGITSVVNNRILCPCSTSDRLNVVNVSNPESPYIEGSVTHEALEGAYVAEFITEKWCICSGRYTNTVVLISLADYSDPQVIDWLRDETYLNGPDDTHWKHDLAWISVTTGCRMTVLKIPQLEGLVREIDVYTDNIGLQEDVTASLIEGTININVYDDITVQEGDVLLLNIYLIQSYDEIGLQDEESVSVPGLDVDISVYDYVYIHPAYRRPNQADDLTAQDYVDVLPTGLIQEINVYDDIGIQDESQQYLILYEIYISDDLTVQEEISQYLLLYEIYRYDSLTIEDYTEPLITAPGLVYINQYDDITVQESANTEIAVYFISVSDDLTVEDATSSYLTIYVINQYDQITVQDESQVTEIGIGTRDINAYDDLTVQENADLFMPLYVVSTGDNITVEDSIASALDLFLISTYDQISLSDEIEAQINPYLISEYESINVSDYVENLIAFKSQEVSVAESVGITDYANAAYIVYPFLQAFLTVQATRSIIDIGQTMSELEVEDTPSIVSVTR